MKKILILGIAALALAACNKPQSQDAAAASGAAGGNGDEKITLAQFEQRRVDSLMKADANGDGKISKDEFIAYMKQRITERGGDPNDPDVASRFDGMFARMDKNGDGFITKDEIQQSAADQFNRIDTDHKGYITRDEMRARFRNGQGGQGGGGGPGGGQGGGGDNGGGGGGGN